eukprot:COSAG01_NODE_65133_length_274_cov_0.594286_1_plen_55_part_10
MDNLTLGCSSSKNSTISPSNPPAGPLDLSTATAPPERRGANRDHGALSMICMPPR